jgi:hypothetical protein
MRKVGVKVLKLSVAIAAALLLALAPACRSTKQNLNSEAENSNAAAEAEPVRQSPFNIVESKVIEKHSPFDHNRPEHQTKTKDCAFCHQRATNDPTPEFPGHAACIDCHRKDFTAQSSRVCVVCHTEPVDAKGTLTTFPARFEEFGIKRFSHRDHMNAEKMRGQIEGAPRCDACHRFDGRGVKASFPGHAECYSCHAHQTNQKLGACDVCHALKAEAISYSPGLGAALSQYNFRHGPHLGKATCDRCHKIADAAASRRSDILEINISRGQRHQSMCWSCHVQARESVCTKCHIRSLPF